MLDDVASEQQTQSDQLQDHEKADPNINRHWRRHFLGHWADELREIDSFDAKGNKAMMNMRIDDKGIRLWHGTQVQIGLHYESIHRSEFDLERALNTGLV